MSTIETWMEGEVAVLRLNRPKANAINHELASKLEAVLEKLAADQPAAVVITGAGRFFSGGLDLRAVPLYSAEEQTAFLQVANRMISKLYCLKVPLVGAINGHAVAAGFMLALTADYRVGPNKGALFGLTEARVGIPFPAAPMVILKAELAPSDVRYTTLLSLNYDCEEAQRRGLLDELVPVDEVLPRALDVARDLATMPADAYACVKYQIRAEAIAELQALNQDQSDPMLAQWISPEAPTASNAVLDRN